LAQSEAKVEDLALKEKRGGTGLSVRLHKEVPFQHPLIMPNDTPWLFERGVAIHPDGKRIAVLLPAEKKVALQARTVGNLSQYPFLLAWVEMDSGRMTHSKEFQFGKGEDFGFSLTPDGDSVCIVAGGRVALLDSSFHTFSWIESGVRNHDGLELRATGCTFVPKQTQVLVEFANLTGPVLPWALKSALLLWDWKKEVARGPIYSSVFILDAVPLDGDRAMVYRQVPNWLYRFRLEEFRFIDGMSSSGVESKGFITSKLQLSSKYVFRVERNPEWPGDPAPSVDTPSTLYDGREYVWDHRVSKRSNPKAKVFVDLTGNVLLWSRESPQAGQEFSLWRHLLHWPLLVSHDELWFAVRAVRFKYWEDNQALGWDSNRFVIFSLDGKKRRLYTSEKFGPQEAITGFALSPDNKTLVVATSRRLLIYDVKETPAP